MQITSVKPEVSRMRRRGMTLVESLLAMLILSIVLVPVLHATTAGHQHLHNNARQLEASRLAEQLIEEMRSRPYNGTGTGRSEWCIPDYAGLTEVPGDLRDTDANLLHTAYQRYSRSANVTDTSIHLTGLGSVAIPARQVQVTVQDGTGSRHTLNALIMEPIAP